MPDIITIERLEVFTCIGVPDEERACEQKLELTISFPVVDLQKAARLDEVAHTVDYFQVARLAGEVARARPRKLIETLGEDLAAAVLGRFAVKWVEIEIRKFILPDAEYVGLRIKRRRDKNLRVKKNPD